MTRPRTRTGWSGSRRTSRQTRSLAGVGGRDWQAHEMGSRGSSAWSSGTAGSSAITTWAAGPARAVDVLKGANCAYRLGPLRAVGFDTRLRGGGAQPHWELALCLALKGGGWSLLYDPAVGVDHFVAPRFDADQNLRGTFNARRLRCRLQRDAGAVGASAVSEKDYFLAWFLLVGTRGQPGLLQLCRLLVLRQTHGFSRLRTTIAGRFAAIRELGSSGILVTDQTLHYTQCQKSKT